MAGINYPLWRQLKLNIVSILETIAAEETLVDVGRNFEVYRDKYFPYIKDQQNTALVNVLTQTVNAVPERSASRRSYLDEVNVFVDMYAIGEGGQVLPADEIAADRLDLLAAQVREGLTRLAQIDLGFVQDLTGGFLVDWDGSVNFTSYDQESEESSGQQAPARWSFTVKMPYIPTDNNEYNDLEILDLAVSEDDIELFRTQFNYTP